jgi:hypothetical protein
MKCRKIKPGTNINYTKRSKTIKVKKALIRGIQIFNWSVKLNWKIDLIKRKNKSKEWGSYWKKKQQKIWLKNEIESHKDFNKSAKENFFLRKMRNKMKNKTYEKLQLKD